MPRPLRLEMLWLAAALLGVVLAGAALHAGVAMPAASAAGGLQD